MSGFTQQVVSAGALSTGLTCEELILIADQRRKNQELQAALATVEGEATKASGEAQQSALNEEATQSMSRAWQMGLEGGFGLVQEGVGQVGEMAANRTETATLLNQNVNHYGAWDSKLSETSSAEVFAGLNHPTESMELVEMGASKALTSEEVDNLKTIRLRDEKGNAINPANLSESQTAALDAAIRKNAPGLDDLKKELQTRSKRADKAAESNSNGVEKRRNQFKTLMTASSQALQAQQLGDISRSQQVEAGIKLAQSQADFAKDSIAKVNRSLEDSNSGLGNTISGLIAASNKEWDANARA